MWCPIPCPTRLPGRRFLRKPLDFAKMTTFSRLPNFYANSTVHNAFPSNEADAAQAAGLAVRP